MYVSGFYLAKYNIFTIDLDSFALTMTSQVDIADLASIWAYSSDNVTSSVLVNWLEPSANKFRANSYKMNPHSKDWGREYKCTPD